VNTYRWTCPEGHFRSVAVGALGTPIHPDRCPFIYQDGRVCRELLELTVEYGEEERCGFEWAMEDPNEEDAMLGRSHVCRLLSTDHAARHICGCGAYIDDGGGES